MKSSVRVSPVTNAPEIIAVPIIRPVITIAMLVFLRVKFRTAIRTVILSPSINQAEIRNRTETV